MDYCADILLLGAWAALAVFVGCDPSGATPDDDSAADDDAGDDDTGGTFGLFGYAGQATADAVGYAGHEELYLIGDGGAGDDLCRIRYELTRVAPREDCEPCEWAFDLVASAPEVVAESGPGCTALGYDAAGLAALDGALREYGFTFEYIGHAAVLMVHGDGGWEAVSFATWSPETGAFSYDWDVGYEEYSGLRGSSAR